MSQLAPNSVVIEWVPSHMASQEIKRQIKLPMKPCNSQKSLSMITSCLIPLDQLNLISLKSLKNYVTLAIIIITVLLFY